MSRLRVSAGFTTLCLLLVPTLASICPNSCVCSTTRDGLHRATCSNLSEVYKFTVKQKHHNINILDLSHNNISKLNHELDRLTEIVTLDLSTNGITKLNKFLHNAAKLVHLNLANNRLKELSLSQLPKSVSSLELTNNLLQNVPSDLDYLVGLEHLELKGNPIDCSCENIMARNRLLATNVFIDNVKCVNPPKLKGRSWLKVEIIEVCKAGKTELNYLDMMLGDQPIDADKISEETSSLKPILLAARSDLEEGKIVETRNLVEDDDNVMYIKVRHHRASPVDNIEGSGEVESTTISDIDLVAHEPKFYEKLVENDDFYSSTIDPLEGSGEGSGFIDFSDHFETTTEIIDDLNLGRAYKPFEDDIFNTSTEFIKHKKLHIYEGGAGRNSRTDNPIAEEKTPTSQIPRDTTVSEHIRVTQAPEVLERAPADVNKAAPHKTGTYVCIAIIVILLVGLIGFAIFKGQMRKRRDRRLLRQQGRDIEKASKEMIDMNKSLLGKPAVAENPVEKKINGKYELVPTHEPMQKKSENGDVANGLKQNDQDNIRNDSPRDSNQNKSSSKDNNLSEQNEMQLHDISFESAPESRKDTHSLSSEDIFVPLNDDDTPKINGNPESDVSQPLINDDQNTNSDFLSPSREYVPVYSPDMGRVRIKISETPKPKTPVLVTRSRSNAGDIIITPSANGNSHNSAT